MEALFNLKTDTTFIRRLNPPVSIYFIFKLTLGNLDATISFANSIYGMMSYTKNGKTDPNEYTYSGYGVSFSSKEYTHSDGKDCYDLVILGVDMSNSKHAENKKISILVLGKNALKINNTSIQQEAELETNCCKKICVLSIHYDFITNLGGEIGYVYINGLKQHVFKTKSSEILNKTLCLRNIMQYDDNSIKKTSFSGRFYDFSLDQYSISKNRIENS